MDSETMTSTETGGKMNLKELLVCKYDGCNSVFSDARILPCGHRTCAEHIDDMWMKVDDCGGAATDADSGIASAAAASGRRRRHQKLKCHFCHKIHVVCQDEEADETDGSFPRDTYVAYLLSMEHGSEHSQAKRKLAELRSHLLRLSDTTQDSYQGEYFKRVEAHIEREREARTIELNAYFDQLVGQVRLCKDKCDERLKATTTTTTSDDGPTKADIHYQHYLDAMRQTTTNCESKLAQNDFELDLTILNGDEAHWKRIQHECQAMIDSVKSVDIELKSELIADQMIIYEPSACSALATTSSPKEGCIYGQNAFFRPGQIDSSILDSTCLKYELVRLCQLASSKFTLLYRASRDGFGASAFHAKCDGRARTLTLVKSLTHDFVFGGYAHEAWSSANAYVTDTRAYLFSLTNAASVPLVMPVKAGGGAQHALYAGDEYGPTFGHGCDLLIGDDSNANRTCYSMLGESYELPAVTHTDRRQAKTLLAGSFKFKTLDIEVFQLSRPTRNV